MYIYICGVDFSSVKVVCQGKYEYSKTEIDIWYFFIYFLTLSLEDQWNHLTHTHLENRSDDVAWTSFHWLLRVKKTSKWQGHARMSNSAAMFAYQGKSPTGLFKAAWFGSLGFRENVYQEIERGLDRQTGDWECLDVVTQRGLSRLVLHGYWFVADRNTSDQTQFAFRRRWERERGRKCFQLPTTNPDTKKKKNVSGLFSHYKDEHTPWSRRPYLGSSQLVSNGQVDMRIFPFRVPRPLVRD